LEGVQANVDELLQLRFKATGIHLHSRRPTVASPAGGRLARFRSRGIDYQESRSYQPGDDIRHMDWRVTARTGRPHTKLYQEERERPILVLAEFGTSMFFGTRGAFKSVIAARVSALLAWAAIANGDRIGALLVGRNRQLVLRPTGREQGVLRLIRELVSWTIWDKDSVATPVPRLSETLDSLNRVARPGSLIIIVSDFYTLDPASEPQLARLRRRHELLACQILDPLEQLPPPPGCYGISDGRQPLLLDTTSAHCRDDYIACLGARQEAVRTVLNRHAIPLLPILTHEDTAASLRRNLKERSCRAPLARGPSP
jgi:uncharacterized protein (DUF58 family)